MFLKACSNMVRNWERLNPPALLVNLGERARTLPDAPPCLPAQCRRARARTQPKPLGKRTQGLCQHLHPSSAIPPHPDCNSWSPLLVARSTGEYCTLLPDDPGFDRLFGKVLDQFGALSLVTDEAGTSPFRLLGVLARHPLLAARMFLRAARYVGSGYMPKSVFRALLRRDVHPVGIGIHNFMDAEKVAGPPNDPVVKARLDSCVFKGAVKRNGEWEAVPMCSMNQQTWSEIYSQRLADPGLRMDAQVPSLIREEPELHWEDSNTH